MARKVKATAAQVSAAQGFRAALGLAPTANGRTVGRCAYGACDKTFTPKSSGVYAHRGCPAGSVGYAAAFPREGDRMDHDAILAAGPAWVAAWQAELAKVS